MLKGETLYCPCLKPWPCLCPKAWKMMGFTKEQPLEGGQFAHASTVECPECHGDVKLYVDVKAEPDGATQAKGDDKWIVDSVGGPEAGECCGLMMLGQPDGGVHAYNQNA